MLDERVVTSAQWLAEMDGSNSSTLMIAVVDGASITVPTDEFNTDYQAILKWVEAGNAIADAAN
jgi:predicted ATP-grasp superfamily ATP-dependent carboligase